MRTSIRSVVDLVRQFALLALLGGSLLGAPLLQAAEPGAPCTDVIIIKAVFGYSPGYDEMIEKFHAAGCRTWIYRPATAIIAAREIEQLRQSGQMQGPVVIVGYSMGADVGTVLAKKLAQRGITVDRMVLMEPTIPGKIHSNVGTVLNVYESRPKTDWWPMLRGIPVAQQTGSSRIANYDLRQYNPGLAGAVGHLNLPANQQVQSMVVNTAVQPAVSASPAVPPTVPAAEPITAALPDDAQRR